VSLVSDSLPTNTKLAVFDAVTSNTALVLPVQQLVQLCRDR
jgi:selenocysteine lyase/cysteine desulfurase